MDIVAIQAAFILGGTGFVAKFIKDKDLRDELLPIVAATLGALSACYLNGTWDVATMAVGVITGGAVTGLYSVAKTATQPRFIEEGTETEVRVRGVES